jgi:hypothetical protein
MKIATLFAPGEECRVEAPGTTVVASPETFLEDTLPLQIKGVLRQGGATKN